MSEVDDIRDPEALLALAYAPAACRPALAALWALDGKLGDMVAAARDPLLAQIRLAWWRDALDALGGGGAPPVDPLLQRLEQSVAPLLPPGALAAIAEGWSILLDTPESDRALVETHARLRGPALFEAAAAVLGKGGWPGLARAGTVYALVDLARRGLAGETALAIAQAELDGGGDERWPRELRPLGMLAALAARDARAGRLEAQGAPRRLLAMLRHRLSGRTGLGGAPSRR